MISDVVYLKEYNVLKRKLAAWTTVRWFFNSIFISKIQTSF